MKIIIDIGHPAHVHLFRNFAHKMSGNGHEVLFTVREKEFETELLKHEGFHYTRLGRHYNSKAGKLWGLCRFTFFLVIAGIRFRPDVFLSHGSMYAALASFILRKSHISLEDTGNFEQIRIYLPFTQAVLTSSVFPRIFGEKQVCYNGYHELAYLHPRWFIPDSSVLDQLKVKAGEKYFILRFIAWKATHDKGRTGLNREEKYRIINLLKEHGTVFISSEERVETMSETKQLQIPPSMIHHALAFAHLYVGEGATMASEAALAGTPSIYINSSDAAVIDDQEKGGLLYHFHDGRDVADKISQLLTESDLKIRHDELLTRVVSQKTDLTAFLVWFVENWPDSFKIMKKDSNYVCNFT